MKQAHLSSTAGTVALHIVYSSADGISAFMRSGACERIKTVPGYRQEFLMKAESDIKDVQYWIGRWKRLPNSVLYVLATNSSRSTLIQPQPRCPPAPPKRRPPRRRAAASRR